MRHHPVPTPAPAPRESLTAAAQPLMEKVATSGRVEDEKVSRAWEMYDKPEVRFACRQYSNAFSSAKIILGRRMALSPLVLILALMLFGWLWGIVGLLLAVPLLVCVKIVLSKIEGLEGWAKLLE